MSAALAALVALVLSTSMAAYSYGGSGSGSGDADHAGHAGQALASGRSTDQRPNIVLISSDDQRLSDMRWMPRTRRLLGDAGITFTHMLSPHPLCCPARAEILTGQYAQNNGVRSNDERLLGGFAHLDGSQTIATWLHDAGYQTGFVGKYLNGYVGQTGAEPGWDIWNPIIARIYEYFGYTMYNEGDPRTYDTLHNADLLGQKSAEYIHRFAADDRPFFLWESQVAPHGACAVSKELGCHGPAIPAERHAHLFAGLKSDSMKDRAYDERDVSDKSRAIRTEPRVDDRLVNKLFRSRIRTLQSLDEAVAGTIRALQETGELDNTVVLFTSDNGYLLGEHRYLSKNMPYEQALRVPLLVRGPGIPAGQTRDQVVSMIDLVPTFLQLADAKATIPVDGRSFSGVLADSNAPGWGTVLIQAGPRSAAEVEYGWAFRGVRTARYTYAHWNREGLTELYDRRTDPSQLENVARDPSYRPVLKELAARAARLSSCSGPGCRPRFGAVPDPRRE